MGSRFHPIRLYVPPMRLNSQQRGETDALDLNVMPSQPVEYEFAAAGALLSGSSATIAQGRKLPTLCALSVILGRYDVHQGFQRIMTMN